MNQLVKVLFGNLLLTRGPQDFPLSNVLFKLSLLVYFVSGMPGLLVNLSFESAILAMSVDTIALLLFVYLCLQAFAKPERFTQTVIALALIGTVFQLIVLPLLLNLPTDEKELQEMAGLPILLLMFVSWNLAVYAHVFRESFSIRLSAAVLLTICYVILTMLARQIFFPGLS